MDYALWLGDAADGGAVAVVAVALVFVDIVSEMDHIIHTLLPYGIAIRVEEAERIIRTAVDSHIDLGDFVIHHRHRFRPAKRALVVAIANVELVVVARISFEARRFDLHRVIDIAGSICLATRFHNLKVRGQGNLVLDAYRCGGNGLFWAVVVKRHIACHHPVVIYRVVLWRYARP